MTDLMALIDVERLGDGRAEDQVNRWVPSRSSPDRVAAVRWADGMDGKMFVYVLRDSRNISVQLTREQMLAFGMACIQAANRESDEVEDD